MYLSFDHALLLNALQDTSPMCSKAGGGLPGLSQPFACQAEQAGIRHHIAIVVVPGHLQQGLAHSDCNCLLALGPQQLCLLYTPCKASLCVTCIKMCRLQYALISSELLLVRMTSPLTSWVLNVDKRLGYIEMFTFHGHTSTCADEVFL